MKSTIIFLFLLFYFQTSAQKEVYFNTAKPEDIKVETLKGVELQIGYNPMYIFDPTRYFNQEIPYYAGFFNEKRIASNVTLGYSVGLSGSRTELPLLTLRYDSVSGNSFYVFDNNLDYKASFSLGLRIGIEPRWYWNLKKRAEQNMAKLNSGWFLSMPITCEYSMFTSFKPNYLSDYQYYGNIILKPTIGFRQSVSKNIFLEGSFGYKVGSYLSRNMYGLNPLRLSTNSELNIKAAYTFK